MGVISILMIKSLKWDEITKGVNMSREELASLDGSSPSKETEKEQQVGQEGSLEPYNVLGVK